MNDTHQERIADLLPEDRREQWMRLSSRFPHANKDSPDELWLLAELIAMVGLVSREQGGGLPSTSQSPTTGKSRDVAEKERQTAATLERITKSVSSLNPASRGTGRGAVQIWLLLTVCAQGFLTWMMWRILDFFEIEFLP